MFRTSVLIIVYAKARQPLLYHKGYGYCPARPKIRARDGSACNREPCRACSEPSCCIKGARGLATAAGAPAISQPETALTLLQHAGALPAFPGASIVLVLMDEYGTGGVQRRLSEMNVPGRPGAHQVSD